MRISDWSSDVCSSDLMAILRAVRSLDLPDWAVGAGAIRNRVWDRMYALPDGPLADIDVLFFNAADTTSAREQAAETALAEAAPGLPWSVRNQARMPMRNGDAPYQIGSAECREKDVRTVK